MGRAPRRAEAASAAPPEVVSGDERLGRRPLPAARDLGLRARAARARGGARLHAPAHGRRAAAAVAKRVAAKRSTTTRPSRSCSKHGEASCPSSGGTRSTRSRSSRPARRSTAAGPSNRLRSTSPCDRRAAPSPRRSAWSSSRCASSSSTRVANVQCVARGCYPTFASSSIPTPSGPTRRSTSSPRADA